MMTLLTNLPMDVLIDQLQGGLILLVLGMGTVFVFLVLLIYSTKLISHVCRRLSPAPAAPAAKKVSAAPARAAAPASAVNKDAEVAAAIAAAWQKNRN